MTAARFERSREALVKDFADVLTEADALLKQASKETGEKASDLRAQVETKLRTARIKLPGASGSARHGWTMTSCSPARTAVRSTGTRRRTGSRR